VPLDLGGTSVTGMHVSVVYALRQALSLDPPGTPVKVIEPYQMLGEIRSDLIEALDVDVVRVEPEKGFFGFQSKTWKPWQMFDGTPVLVPESFNTEPSADGSLYQYPEGDRTVQPSGRMPSGGFYHDAIIRQPPIDDEKLKPEDNMEEFTLLADEELGFFEREVNRLYDQTDKAIVASFGGTAFGDISMVPAPWLKHPKGIRDIEEWYISTVKRKDFILKVFERQCEIGLANLERLARVTGDRVAVVFVTGTDFGTQGAPFLSVKAYRELYFPFHKTICDWIHRHTTWKTFMHSCGSILPLIPSFIEAGIDIINPVQWPAVNMDAQTLKDRFGDQLVFWGGGVNPQRTLPFGTPNEVRAEVAKHVRILGARGGFVFNTIHNVQPKTPIENVLAMYEAFRQCRDYPLEAAL
jgi:Uroporphyrinogen decarboxylase (URO-D)